MVAERLTDADQCKCLHRVLHLTAYTLRYSANGYYRQRAGLRERPPRRHDPWKVGFAPSFAPKQPDRNRRDTALSGTS